MTLCRIKPGPLAGAVALVTALVGSPLQAFCPVIQPYRSSYHQYHDHHHTILQAGTFPNDQKKATEPPPSTRNKFTHAVAILAMPYTSIDRIANEAILNCIVPRTDKLSVVLRCQSPQPPSLARLRRYVGEVYSQLWDCVMNSNDDDNSSNNNNLDTNQNTDSCGSAAPAFNLPDIVVYPQNLPNAAPEAWIDIQPDLQVVCSHDLLTGWTSEAATGRGCAYQQLAGVGGLSAHVEALNAERRQRNLMPVQALAVPNRQWPVAPPAGDAEEVLFVDDEVEDRLQSPLWRVWREQQLLQEQQRLPAALQQVNGGVEDDNNNDDECNVESLLGGVRIPAHTLYESVCCGGTFDGLHFGHRKLLTLAVSSVNPLTGRLLIGVTMDQMLHKKKFAAFMPSFDERSRGVRNFIHRLAPGIMNRVQVVPIGDAFGPPGQPNQDYYDALVLSHETLETGYQLNRYRREQLGLHPLKLLCTRRTEAHGMSSTTLRRLRSQQVEQVKQLQQQQEAAAKRIFP
jgi:cytidyltransferase-like protein